MPGMIEGHSRVLLHAYNETSWNDQVLKESLGLRTARAVNHCRPPCKRVSRRCGISVPRAPGTPMRVEAGGGAGDHSGAAHDRDDEGDHRDGELRAEGFAPQSIVPQGAEEADDANDRPRWCAIRWSRRRLDKGVRGLSVGRRGEAGPTFSWRSCALIVEVARVAAVRWSLMRIPLKASGARQWPEWRRSSTATAARPEYSD